MKAKDRVRMHRENRRAENFSRLDVWIDSRLLADLRTLATYRDLAVRALAAWPVYTSPGPQTLWHSRRGVHYISPIPFQSVWRNRHGLNAWKGGVDHGFHLRHRPSVGV